MDDKIKNFMEELHALCKRHRVAIYSGMDDDGENVVIANSIRKCECYDLEVNYYKSTIISIDDPKDRFDINI